MTKLDPRIDLKLAGDWGNANFHIIVGWIAANMRWRAEEESTFWIKTATGYRDTLRDLASGEVDLAITTPYHVTLQWAREGREFFEGSPFPGLRTLGYFPHDDRLVFAVKADTGITSFDDIIKQKYPLKIATTCRNKNNLLTYVLEETFRLHGIDMAEFESWGGKLMEHDHPRLCLPQVLKGEADAVFNEGVMVPQWFEVVEKVPMRFISFEQSALDVMKQKGLRTGVLEKGRLGADRDIPCLDWSNFAIIVREDMDDDVAYRITSVMVEELDQLESRFRHQTPERSPLTYPVEPKKMWRTEGAPLHPGAERYFREHGLME